MCWSVGTLALAPKVVGEGGRHSAISGKGERLIRLSRSSQVFQICSLPFLLYLFLASHLFGRVSAGGFHTPVGRPIRPTGSDAALVQRLAIALVRPKWVLSLLPPCGPLVLALAPVPWSGLWGAPPFCFLSFSLFFRPSLLVRCSRF